MEEGHGGATRELGASEAESPAPVQWQRALWVMVGIQFIMTGGVLGPEPDHAAARNPVRHSYRMPLNARAPTIPGDDPGIRETSSHPTGAASIPIVMLSPLTYAWRK